MYFPTRYATKITAASISLVTVTVFLVLTVQSQEPAAQDKSAATTSQTPAQKQKDQQKDQKFGTELDDRSLVPGGNARGRLPVNISCSGIESRASLVPQRASVLTVLHSSPDRY